MTFKPPEKDILELQQAMEDGLVTSAELTGFYLDRIEALDKNGPKLNSIITVNDNAVKEAAALDAERKAHGKRSQLHGIPIVLKDNFDTGDMPTTASSVLLADNRPSSDAFVVGKLRSAGAVILAKTNLSEFACHGFTDGTLIGQTLNPYDLTRTPGGSSGGTAAAVAANLAAAGLGTDTVNSVRSPASASSLVGFRPTTGLFSRAGIIPVSKTQDSAGTLTRSVCDAALLFDICAGFDLNDSISAKQAGHIPPSYTECLKSGSLRGKRLGVISDLLGHDREVLKVMDAAINILKQNGAEIMTLDIPEFEADNIVKRCNVQLYEFKEQLNSYLRNANTGVPDFQFLVDSGKLYPAIAEFMKECAAIENPASINEYGNRLLEMRKYRDQAYYVMAKYDLDAFVYPHQKILVRHVGLYSQDGRNGGLASMLAFPAVTVPAGFSAPDANAPIGVPVGIEFMARPWAEAALFEIAYGFEQNSRKRRAPIYAN